MVSPATRAFYQSNGYAIVRGLFSPEEIDNWCEHYMGLRAMGSHPGDMVGVNPESDDPLLRFPRMIHMHHWDDRSLQWLLDPRLGEVLKDLLGAEPLAVQTMLYFKPPGARGQALHQDNFYLRVKPGTCMAAWLALDACDEENGCMQIVPGSQDWPILCPEAADTSQSFTDVTVPLPSGAQPIPILMDAGDVLFFNGSIVHGSFPNRTKERFRRSLIGHYIEGNTEQVGEYYGRILRMDGTQVSLNTSPEGGPCGVWVHQDGHDELQLAADGLKKPGELK